MIETVATIYLAGTRYKEEPDSIWKQIFMDHVNKLAPGDFEFVDPIPNVNLRAWTEVVPLDKKVIDQSDIVVAYIQRPTFGTAMEICHAFEQRNIITFAINPNGQFINDIWLNYHTQNIFRTVQDCADYTISTWNKPARYLNGPRSEPCMCGGCKDE